MMTCKQMGRKRNRRITVRQKSSINSGSRRITIKTTTLARSIPTTTTSARLRNNQPVNDVDKVNHNIKPY